jgi:hypothetical protein
MTAPPRFTESLLTTVGATPEYAELVIGDLAEEFSSRVRHDGVSAARSWYRREALRSLPHLFRNGLRDRALRGVTHFLGVVITAWLFVGMTLGAAFSVLFSAVIRFWPEYRQVIEGGAGWVPFVLFILSSATFTGGMFAAWLDKRAPLASATALGVVWATTELVLMAIGRVGPTPFWFPFVVPPLMLALAVAGGVTRLRLDRTAEARRPVV